MPRNTPTFKHAGVLPGYDHYAMHVAAMKRSVIEDGANNMRFRISTIAPEYAALLPGYDHCGYFKIGSKAVNSRQDLHIQPTDLSESAVAAQEQVIGT